MIDKVLNPYVLIVINIGIIIATEMSGMVFMDTGIIHGIAILFIILALTRIMIPRTITDPTLKKFVSAAFIALVIFAASHVAEFLGYFLTGTYNDASFANVANFYIVSLFTLIIGIEIVLKSYYERSKIILWVSTIGIIIAAALTVLFFIKPDMITLDPGSIVPYIYVVAIVGVTGFGFVNLLEVKRVAPEIAIFTNYISGASALIAISALVNVLYEVLSDSFGVADYQAMYLAHFAFYISLSVLFLSFGKPLEGKGLHAAPASS